MASGSELPWKLHPQEGQSSELVHGVLPHHYVRLDAFMTLRLSRLQLARQVSLSLACLLTAPRHSGLCKAHKLQRQNAAKYSVVSQAGQQSNMSLHYPKPLVHRARDKHTSTIIILHGLGDTGSGWYDFASEYESALPQAKWVFPNAPTVRSA